MKFIKRFIIALSTGYIFFFFSERMFWSFWRPDDDLSVMIGGIILYTLAAYIFLIIVNNFKVKNISALFIAGASFGWLIEGVVAMTLFGAEIPFPFTISWTGLAWHALITVTIGWATMLKALNENSPRKILLISFILGLFWGYWSIAWPLETPPIITSVPEYFLHAIIATILLIISYKLTMKLKIYEFQPSKTEILLLLIIALCYFFFITISYIPIAIIILPILFGIIYLTLRQNKKKEKDLDILKSLNNQPENKNYFLILIMPITATIIYGIFINLNLIHRSNLIIMILTTITGFIFFIVSLFKIWKRKNHHNHLSA